MSTNRYLESGEELMVGDLVDIWHLVNYDLGTVKIIEKVAKGVFLARGGKPGDKKEQECYLRWRRGKNPGNTLTIVEKSDTSGRWVGAHDDWMWGQGARRPLSESNFFSELTHARADSGELIFQVKHIGAPK
jgi:hypothetical protein